MLFKDYHIYPMYKGVKTYTRRFWKVPHVRVGHTYDVTHKFIYEPEDVVGYLHVIDVYRQPLGMMTEQDAYNEGAYDLQHYFKVLEMINKKPVEMTDVPVVVKFRFTLSDLIDDDYINNHYFIRWKEHMIKIGLNLWIRG